MNIKNLIKDNIVTPEFNQNSSSIIGTIVSIDENRLTSVEITGRGGSKFILENIPIVSQGRGIVINNYYIGDKVILDCNSNNLHGAKIVGVYHKNILQPLEDVSHIEQDLNLSVKKESIKNVITQYDMYNFNPVEITDYTKTYNFNTSIAEDFKTFGCYNVHDIGITHPISKATIKCMDDGSILISSGIDTCISISKDGDLTINAKKINIVSNLDINIDTSKEVNVNCKKMNVKERGV